QASNDLDRSGDKHKFMTMPAKHSIHKRRKILIPIHQQMGKLINTSNNWCGGEPNSQNLIGLPCVAGDRVLVELSTKCRFMKYLLHRLSLLNLVDLAASLLLILNKSSTSLTYCIYR